MRQSELFTKTRKEAPKDEVSKNASLLIRAGFINKEMAGVYDLLPLGLRVMKKIENIIRGEMEDLGAQEVSMSALQSKELWERTSRWEDDVIDVWFKTKLKSDSELGLATTHEEPITNMLEQFVSSYKDLPFSVYQFQTKFRNELRAQAGLLRGREFLMKDLYSFNTDEASHQDFYERAKEAYRRIFEKVGIGDKTYLTRASGGSFSEFSHEFQTVSDAGEDTIYITDEGRKEAVNKEIENTSGEETRAIEVGNIFTLGTKFSDPYLPFKNENGEERPVFMGSYGIGLGRLMGTVAEVLSDDKGLIWPESVSPFQVHLLSLGESGKDKADKVYERFTSEGIEVLYDDRDLRAGEKFADADLIGIPTSVIIGDESEGNSVEVKDRKTGDTRKLDIDDLIKELKK